MKFLRFQDKSGNKIQLSISSDGDYRVYFDYESDTAPCLKLSDTQAIILINGLKDLMEFGDD